MGQVASRASIHTEVQTRQNQGKIAFYPSGSWLENEQKSDTPTDFEYALIAPPQRHRRRQDAVRGDPGAPPARTTSSPPRARTRRAAWSTCGIMLSKEGAKGFTEKSGNITVVTGAAEGLELSPGNKSVADAQTAAGQNIVTYSCFENWYKELETELRKQTNALMFGRITADEFCERMQRRGRQDQERHSITKQQRSV